MIAVLSLQSFKSKQEVIAECIQKSIIAIDTESENGDLLGLAIAWSPHDAVFFSADDPDVPLQFLSSAPCIFHNCLWDIPILENNYSLTINPHFDTMLAAQACGHSPALRDLSVPFDFSHRNITDLLYDNFGTRIKVKEGKKKRDLTLKELPLQEIGNISCKHAQAAYKIWEKLKDEVPEAYHLDMDVIPLLLFMHKHGIRIDTKLIREKHQKFKGEIEYLRELCEGLGFNPASPKQVGLALANQGFMTHFTRSGQMSTDSEALLPLFNKTPIVPLVLKYREKAKLYSTYISPLCGVDRVYPKYHIVRTGRFASSPNIQNVPEGERDSYIPDEGDFFWSADAYQIEPLLMAYFSGDKKMLEDVLTGDFYQPIADRYNISRYTAKQLVLAGSYEGGIETLVETSHKRGEELSPDDAQHLLSKYYSDYKRFKEWKDEVKKEAEMNGYIRSLFGRKRTLESMMENEELGYDPFLKVVNSIIQSSAADILKLALRRLINFKVSAHIHDEILISTSADIPLSIFDNLCGIPLKWKVRKGSNWRDLYEV